MIAVSSALAHPLVHLRLDPADRASAQRDRPEEGWQLLLENEKEVVGDLTARCLQIINAVDSSHLRFIWEPANFVQCGIADLADHWWGPPGETVGYIHIKDALLPEEAAHSGCAGWSKVTVAGEDDGQVGLLLARLQVPGYTGMLFLEPHLLEARHSSGFSGAEAMAVGALRKLMAEVGISEGRYEIRRSADSV